MRYLLALILLSGCTAGTSSAEDVGTSAVPLLTLSVAPSDVPDVSWAVDEWQRAKAPIAHGTSGLTVAYGELPAGVLGRYYTSGKIVIRYGMRDSLRRRVLLHELGHAMGLGHLPSGVMQETTTWDIECIDADAAEALGGVGTCPQP